MILWSCMVTLCVKTLQETKEFTLYHHMIFPRGMRSGTVPHTLVVGLGAACKVAGEEMEVR